jgi:outer membrane immunogenic protein
MMKLLIGTAISLAAVTGAAAADLTRAPVYTKAPPAPAAFSWTGFYIGGNIGGKWANVSGTVDVAPATALFAALPSGASLPIGSSTQGSFIGGGQLGYNWQTGPIVFGIEGDIDAQHWNTTQVLTTFASGTVFVPGDFFTVESTWQASLRGRLGYAWDRFLLYATGGVAWTNVKVGTNFLPFAGAPGTFATDSVTLTGGTVGGGLEYAFWSNVSLGIEGRYTWYGSHAFNGGTVALGIAPFVFPAAAQTLSLNTAEVIERINWKF